jgi:hypothetical protein
MSTDGSSVEAGLDNCQFNLKKPLVDAHKSSYIYQEIEPWLEDCSLPIPYEITTEGRYLLEQWRCDHQWQVVAGFLSCPRCGIDLELPAMDSRSQPHKFSRYER